MTQPKLDARYLLDTSVFIATESHGLTVVTQDTDYSALGVDVLRV